MSTTSDSARMAYAEEALAKGDEAAQQKEIAQIDWYFECLRSWAK